MKHKFVKDKALKETSRPAWGAWIETMLDGVPYGVLIVAPRMGRVD